MEGTDSGTGEFSVGSIVWVRRRNGSWWPGKIVGPEELSASHLTSPRSGTPVKLLGREDASVDWYNLEKSKRVKAFRCGEFDDCIERAESSQGMPIKKREKYARREDAILHALDLEKQQMRKQKLSIVASDGSSQKSASFGVKKGFATNSETLRNNSAKLGTAKSNQISKKLEVTPKSEILDSPVISQKFKEGNQLSGEEDHADVVPRMRGLQDFGLKIVPSKTTLSSFVASNGLRRPTVENSVGTLPCVGSIIGSSSKMNGKNSLPKRKRLNEDLVRRRETRRPLVQVLQSSVKSEEAPDSVQPDSSIISTSISGGLESVGAICKAKRSKCMYFPADSSESLDYKAVSQSDIEMTDSQNETDTSETDSSGSDTDSSETEEDEMAALSDVVPTESEVGYMGRHEARQHGSMSHDDINDSVLSSDMSHFYTRYPSSAHEAVSKWQLKGKRNIRSLTKRSVGANILTYGAYPEEKDFRGETIGMDKRYFSSRSDFKSRSLVEWDDWSSEDRRVQYGGKSRSILIDVEIKVQASYRRAHVPLVSLMSKLNGHAIIGHPVQVEALEDGSSSDLIPARDDFGSEAIENDGNAPLPHAWRTARRTANVRVPRPQPSSYHDGGEATAYGFPKSNFGNFGSFGKGTLVRKIALHGSDRKYKKSPKKIGASSSSQKTRTLSSIAIEHKLSNKRIHITSHSQIDGTVKRESVGPTTVACIPVKLVFSRLLEKINRPESAVGLHCTL